MKYLAIAILSIIAAWLYRWGGQEGKSGRWRDAGVPLCGLLGMLILGVKIPWWLIPVPYGLMWLALTTYYDDIFGYDNYWVHGFGVAAAYLPLRS